MTKRFKWTTVFLFSFCLINIFPWVVPSIAQEEPPDYLIGPNDILNIHVWREPELTRDVTVTPDGRITFPLIGKIMAQGKTVTELKEIITKKLKNFVTAPEVTVIVNESRSRKIYVIGQVNAPGPYPLAPDMTVLQALSTAGGFTQWADRKNILVVRRQGEKEIQLHFNYKEYVSRKVTTQVHFRQDLRDRQDYY